MFSPSLAAARSAAGPFEWFYAQGGAIATSGSTYVIPDEDSTPPSYDDYQITGGSIPSGWGFNGAQTSEEYDETNNEYVITRSWLYNNSGTTAKTVYGLKVGYYAYYHNATNQGWASDNFLIAREHFENAVTVQPGEIVKLTLTYHVGRHGVRIDGANGGV